MKGVSLPTNLNLPIAYPDSRINAGSLYLVDLSNPEGYDLGTNAPGNGAMLPNLAWRAAAKMIGSGTRNTLSTVVSNTLDAASGKVELTSKKGLHIITSQVAGAQSKSFIATLPPLIAKYIYDNPTHNFFFDKCFALTRLPKTTDYNNQIYELYGFDTPANNYGYFMRMDTTVPAVGGRGLGLRRTDDGTALGNFYRNVAYNGNSGNRDAAYNTTNFKGWKVGPGFGFQSFEVNKTPSMIIYWQYIEDLTVSGRPYTQADADSFARYQAAFAVGGKYYGDTYTDPATLL